MIFLIHGQWMGLPIEAIPHEGTVRIGGCFCTSMADFLEAVAVVLTQGPLNSTGDARLAWFQRIQNARIEPREDGDYIVLDEAA